uniref:Uncharacterized protein n=1 Tax=Anopheles maculatus TaxID=74869 RepID=A0A182STX8_9DIPT
QNESSNTQQEASSPSPIPQQQPSASPPVNPTSTTPVGTGNNILNAQLSGSFHGSEDTTDDELLDAMHRHRAKQAQVRSAPDMPSTSMGAAARLGVAALPNINFNPAGGPTADVAPGRTDTNRRAPRNSSWRPKPSGNNNNHIV